MNKGRLPTDFVYGDGVSAFWKLRREERSEWLARTRHVRWIGRRFIMTKCVLRIIASFCPKCAVLSASIMLTLTRSGGVMKRSREIKMNKNKIINRKIRLRRQVLVLKTMGPGAEKFYVVPCDDRASVWLNDETQARKLALDLANESQGRLICRF